ncbi:MAG: hypothetical protein LBF25_00060 [Puniceicoccales bacterium]|jgi:hypothetical protein|nr:hypothetical protein [Puniceicoccales bacterium]
MPRNGSNVQGEIRCGIASTACSPQTTMEEAMGEIPPEPQASRDPSRAPGNHMVADSEWQGLRQHLENETFPQYFATHEGNYNYIKKLFLDQIASSFSDFSMAFKYYLLSQHTALTGFLLSRQKSFKIPSCGLHYKGF